MKIIKPNGTGQSTGAIGTPQSRDWLREWIENKGHRVLLDCGCIADLNDRALTIIKQFEGCTVGCERCNRFASVIETVKVKSTIPDEPMF